MRLFLLHIAIDYPHPNEQKTKKTIKHVTNDHQQPRALTSPFLLPFPKIICHAVTFGINPLR